MKVGVAVTICRDKVSKANKMENGMIWLLGDPHGKFDYIITMVKTHKPDAIIFLGDLECPLPLDVLLRPILDLTEVWFIHGNHDSDKGAYWHNLHGNSLAERNLHGRVATVAGYRVAGLGGTFEAPVWLPGEPETGIQNYQEYLSRLSANPQPVDVITTKKQHALSHIYPDDYFCLGMEQADILVCHEAPSCHPYGYPEIDDLATSLGVKQVFHGHHHDCLDYRKSWPSIGFEVYGVGFRSIMGLNGEVLCKESAHEKSRH
jgi:predicted phosphodiesterase